jgi:hypothetical protein
MTTNKRHNNHHHSNKRTTQSNKDKILVQRVPLEAQSSVENNIEIKKAEKQSETQQFMYAQSSKFSSVARNLIFGIMGTIWAFSFKDGEITLHHPWLSYALLLSIIFLLCDVIHYFSDTMSYNRQQYKIDHYKEDSDFVNHEKRMDYINKRSHRFIIAKFILYNDYISRFYDRYRKSIAYFDKIVKLIYGLKITESQKLTAMDTDKIVILDINQTENKFSYLSNIERALNLANLDIEALNDTIDSVSALKPACDKIDYTLSACSGALMCVLHLANNGAD